VLVIAGEDDAGWTLEGFVIPRLASGLIGCEEIDVSHPIMREVPAPPAADDVPLGPNACPHCGYRPCYMERRDFDECPSCSRVWPTSSGAFEVPLYRQTEAQLRSGVNEFTQDDPPPYDVGGHHA